MLNIRLKQSKYMTGKHESFERKKKPYKAVYKKAVPYRKIKGKSD